MSKSSSMSGGGFSPAVATGEFVTDAIRQWGLDLAVRTCPDMTLRQFRAIVDGRARLIGDTGSGVFYKEDSRDVGNVAQAVGGTSA